MASPNLIYAWGNNPRREELKGRACKMIAEGNLNSCLLEFENGERVISSKFSVKPRPVVDGDGPIPCTAMIIGEAPGSNEEIQGKPFVGKAGNILNGALTKAGLDRDECYVTNIYKYRPPNNRPPTPEEIKDHIPLLIEEYKKVKPDYVLLMGNTALHTLTSIEDGIMKARGHINHYKSAMPNSRLYATIHPSAAGRGKSNLEIFEADVKVFAKIVRTQFEVLNEH